MLSVIIGTLNSERALVPTLAALVSGATAGLVSEVIIADGGSQDDTAAVADVAGCSFVSLDASLGQRLKHAALTARAPWLLFLRPGIVLDTSWVGESQAFIERAAPDTRAAVFRRGTSTQAGVKEAFSLLVIAFGAGPRPDQGLIIPRDFYREIGGHAEAAADPESDVIRRIGRRRIARLSTRAIPAGQ
jgi:glycosyltransferase involved in cell wall biosynthesis